MSEYEKIILVIRKTRLRELEERFNSRAQAKFYLERSGVDFVDYVREDDTYRRSLDVVREGLEFGMPVQAVERALVPTLIFSEKDLVVTLGQDGLVANTAKYVGHQPIVAINPDPERFDGVLLPFETHETRQAVRRVLSSKAHVRKITLAEAELKDGQRLLGFNDLFIGAASHVSARYLVRWGEREETQSSSGVLISTGAGSTGWLSSVFNMAAGVAAFSGGHTGPTLQIDWEDRRLVFVVREPFVSRHSTARLVVGVLEPGQDLVLESLMPEGGVIFSDGVESDRLEFNSGAVVTVQPSAQRAHLVAA